MRKLIRGLLDFQRHSLPAYRMTFERLASGQAPDCLFIACADSRLVPNLLVTRDPGDLFVVRNVGNLIPPADAEGHSTGDRSEPAAIEFSLNYLPVEDVVICGHSGCGAMKAIHSGGLGTDTPNLDRWLDHGRPALERMNTQPHLGKELSEIDRLSQHNVLLQLEHVRSYPIVKKKLAEGTIRLHGWWFDIGNAMVHAWRAERGQFVPIDEEEGEQLLRELDSNAKTEQQVRVAKAS